MMYISFGEVHKLFWNNKNGPQYAQATWHNFSDRLVTVKRSSDRKMASAAFGKSPKVNKTLVCELIYLQKSKIFSKHRILMLY